MRPPLHVRLLLSAAAVWLCVTGATAQFVDEVYPREPEDGERVGATPVFSVGFRGSDLFKVRFKLEMSRDDFDTIDYTFDGLAEPGPWAFTALDADDPEAGAILWVDRPLAEGTYRWRVAAWAGVAWVAGEEEREVVVDRTPPAPIDTIRMDIDRSRGAVELRWDPVYYDERGERENVVKYYVYRYTSRPFLGLDMFRVGEAEEPRFVDEDPRIVDLPLLFYRITSQDEAGNENERFVFKLAGEPVQ